MSGEINLPKKLLSVVEQLIEDLRQYNKLNHIPHILIIEDDRRDRDLMRMAVVAVGCRVTCAENGELGLAALHASRQPNQQAADLIFLDMKLPGMDGIAVLQKVRTIAPKTPVVFITSAVASWTIDQAAKYGYVSMLEKPLDREDLREILFQHRIPFRNEEGNVEQAEPED